MPAFTVTRRVITTEEFDVDAADGNHARAIVEDGLDQATITPDRSETSDPKFREIIRDAAPAASTLTVTTTQQNFLTPNEVADIQALGATIQ